jgi:hypothetical protein
MKLDSSLIRPYEDFAHLDNGAHRHFSVEGPKSRLLFFGCRHVWDLEDPMFSEIVALADTTKPDLFLVEGLQGLRRDAPVLQRQKWLKDISSLPLKEAVHSFGERGFVINYAIERNIPVECPEPKFREEVQHIIQQGFSRDGIVGYYVYRMVHQWLNSRNVPSIADYLAPTINELKALTEWADYDWSFAKIAALSEKFWKAPLKLDDARFYSKGVSPFTARKCADAIETNEVCAASGLFRDQAIAEAILSARNWARSIFVVFGSGHSYTLEDALKASF